MNVRRLFLATPTMHEEEQQFIKEAFDFNWIAPLGHNVNMLEKELAAYVGIPYATALSSGTAALHMATKLAHVEPYDVVFCSDLTFSATVNPVCYEKGCPVFIDSETQTWNMDPLALEKAFAKYPHPQAVILVHLYGVPAQIQRIQEICAEHHVPLIEDAAESLGALYQDKQTGTFGQYGVYSFNGNKIITTSGGGMLVSESQDDIQKAQFWATQSRDPAPHYQHSEIGYNYRMSNVLAGIGRGQIRNLSQHISLKKQIYDTYQKAFADIPYIHMNPYVKESAPNFWLSCLFIDPQSGVTPPMVIDALEAENIESRPIWKPMHLQPVFQGYDYITVQNGVSISEHIFENGVCLPSDIKNTAEDMQRIIQVIKNVFTA